MDRAEWAARHQRTTASKATVEAKFRNIKHGLFKRGNLPIWEHQFIGRYLSAVWRQDADLVEGNNSQTIFPNMTEPLKI